MAQIREEQLKAHLEAYNQTRPFASREFICHAPFVSMNFDQSGDVTVCCYNRSFVIGKYPQNSVSEIWNSPKTIELRQAIKELNLDKGCYNCKEQIVSRNYYSTLARNYDLLNVFGDQAAATGPRILEFEISNLCNLECIMCNGHFSSLIRKNREKLPPTPNPYDDQFVEQLRPYWKTVEWAKFLGGEPFLNNLYFKIWKQISEENPETKVVITSNATIINSKVEWVLENVKPLMVLSIDSMVKETYEKIRVNAVFENTMENLKRYVFYAQENGRTVDLAICPMIYNWQEIPHIFDWGTEHIAIVNTNTLTNPPELSLKSLGAARLREIVKYYRSYKLKTCDDFSKEPSSWYKVVSRQNAAKFEGLINQLEFWTQELEHVEQNSKTISLGL